MKKIFTFVVGILLAFFVLYPSSASALDLGFESLAEPSPKIMISEVKLGGIIDGQPTEFVELFNANTERANLKGWIIERAKAAAVIDNCNVYPWNVSSNIKQYPLGSDVEELYIEANSTLIVDNAIIGNNQFTDETSGAVRLIDPGADESSAPIQHDLVGWGGAPCKETEPTDIPNNGTSLTRYMDCAGIFPIDSNNNLADFAVNQTPSPVTLTGLLLPECEEDAEEEPPICTGVVLSELLPNPASIDTGKEYIEIHNPTNEVISLLGCSLRLGELGPEYALPDGVIEPSQYLAFYDSETDITLPNASGGTVWLLSTFDEEGVKYPDALSDSVAWALIGGEWQQTLKPTPNSPNELAQKTTEGGKGGGSGLKPCNPDQFRNPLTNRCKLKNSLTSELKPCRADQFRNPETNRCKLKFSTTSQLKPCNPDQFRNPETNRCKKKDSGNTLKPCRAGQERNPETNRCRKVRGASSGSGFAKVQDVEAPIVSGSKSWWVAGTVAAGVVGYAGWEWRREALGFLSSIKKKLFS